VLALLIFAIAAGAVSAMGGTVTASNREDRSGAVFTIKFPAARIEAPSPSPPALTNQFSMKAIL